MRRGFTTEQEAFDLLDPLNCWIPKGFPDLAVAVERVSRARINSAGHLRDYDADGMTSSALLLSADAIEAGQRWPFLQEATTGMD